MFPFALNLELLEATSILIRRAFTNKFDMGGNANFTWQTSPGYINSGRSWVHWVSRN